MANKTDQLKLLANLRPPFPDSVFTTAEICYCDVPNPSRKNWDGAFYGLEAFTTCGAYDWTERGGIVFWDDDRVIPLRPGTTVVFPAGTKRFSFVPVAPHEKQFIFRQYSNMGAFRWIEKGGRSDSEFEELASVEEEEAWIIKRERRGQTAARMYSKLDDIYIF
ncbi:hypothetical protein B0H13DRAFT_1654926 [Mycena leptocephala]|nr:hypothetical protein B0H13DRAFT_1658934 [Mycena leptocephala]KAJ7830845.1 hypothetical protein B0H13DRAFT_1654926 [Mycena leptocephala]